MTIDKARLEPAALAAMQALLTKESGKASEIARRAVEYAQALLERVDAADLERQARQASPPRP